MASIWELIAERETAATAAEQLREQIGKLPAELALAEAELADLAVTRVTLTRLTGTADTSAPADTTVTRTAYQQILAVFATATSGMRAKDVCLALGLGITAKDTEGMRAKLKRLASRHILIETEPGLFVRASKTPSA